VNKRSNKSKPYLNIGIKNRAFLCPDRSTPGNKLISDHVNFVFVTSGKFLQVDRVMDDSCKAASEIRRVF